MGVKLSSIVPKTFVDFKDLKGKTIAVDFSNTAYQFLASIRGPDGTPLMDNKGHVTSVYMGIMTRVTNLMAQGIKLCFVFDGVPPDLKFKEQHARKERKALAQNRYQEAQEINDIQAMAKFAKQNLFLTKDIIKDSKEILSALGIPVIQAPSESDAQIAYLCREGIVDYGASNDHDLLLFGCPKLLLNITLSQKRKISGGKIISIKPELLDLKEILKTLNVTQDQLIILGICIGTDYNPGGIKGIGPKKALKLLQQDQEYEKMFKELNVEFDYKKIREIYKTMPVEQVKKLTWKPLDEKRLKKVLIDEHDFSTEKVESILKKLKEEEKENLQKGLGEFF